MPLKLADICPAGVYVDVPVVDPTVAVISCVAKLTAPDGVNVPVDENDVPLNSADTLPEGV